jgi:DNA-binding HxlR family transcriptional regulator
VNAHLEGVEEPPLTEYCSRYHRAAELIGRRWASSILRALLVRPRRFGELMHAIPGLSDRLLSERLRDLEEAGLVKRSVAAGHGAHVEYGLTAAGRDLGQVVNALRSWVQEWMPAEGWPKSENE